MRRLCFILVSFTVLVYALRPASSQPPQALMQFFTETAEELQHVFRDFDQTIHPAALAGVLVAPTQDAPGDLGAFPAKGKLIGSIYTSKPLIKFGLKHPGIYAIRLHRNASGGWQAAFLNELGLVVSVFMVEVKESEALHESPRAFFTFFERGIAICWAHTCVEI